MIKRFFDFLREKPHWGAPISIGGALTSCIPNAGNTTSETINQICQLLEMPIKTVSGIIGIIVGIMTIRNLIHHKKQKKR